MTRPHLNYAVATILLLFSVYYLFSRSSEDDDITFLRSYPQITSGDDLNQTKHYAVLGGSLDQNYMFPLPITALFWRRLNIDVIICFAGIKEEYMSKPSLALTIKLLENLKAKMIFLETDLAPAHTISQTCRIYVSASPDIHVRDNDILITSDSDLWIFETTTHIPVEPARIFLYNSGCCGMTKKPGQNISFPMVPMATIAMSAQLWRTLVDVKENSLKDGDVLAHWLYKEMGENIIKYGKGKPSITESWYADQIIISEKIHLFKQSSLYKKDIIGFFDGHPLRYDRANWPAADYMQNNFGNLVHDAHILSYLFVKDNWEKTLPLLKLYFDEDIIIDLIEYRNQFVALLEYL